MADGSPARPEVSVVVTVVTGREAVAKTVASLLAGDRRDWLEVLVPLEADHPSRPRLAASHPAAVMPVVDVPPGASDHERFDRRRTTGVLASQGGVVAIVEDHGTPAADWPDRVREAHRRLPHAVIGGVVTNGVPRALNDALWLCDFGRYAPPQDEGARPWLTDVNVSYKRADLFAVRHAWDPRYHEPLVHDALRARGATLWLDPAMVVREERPPMPVGAALKERFEWGRLYGELRTRGSGPAARLARGAASTVVMPLLVWRIVVRRRGRIGWTRLLAATPWISVLLLWWCFGEAAGTIAPRRSPP